MVIIWCKNNWLDLALPLIAFQSAVWFSCFILSLVQNGLNVLPSQNLLNLLNSGIIRAGFFALILIGVWRLESIYWHWF